MGVAPLTIIKYVNVLKDTGLRFSEATIVLMMYQLCLQGVEEDFSHGIISTVSLATHRALDAICSEHRSVIRSGILASLV